MIKRERGPAVSDSCKSLEKKTSTLICTMAALLAGTTHCAQCVTDSVRVYVYICVCNSAGFAWGYQRPFCAWMGLLQGSLLTRRETQQGVVLMLYSRTLAEKEIGGKMSLSSNSALS